MDESKAAAILSSIAPDQHSRFLAGLCHEVTISARELYSRDVSEPTLNAFRTLNEVQHRLTGLLLGSLDKQPKDFAASFIASMFFGDRPDKAVTSMLSRCLERTIEPHIKQ